MRNISAYVANIGGVDARTTTTEIISNASRGKLVTLTNASPVAVTLQVGGASGAITDLVLSSGGTGYAVSDTFTIAGGTGGTGHVVSVTAGVVTAVALNIVGTGYSVNPSEATTATSGVGTGLTVGIFAVSSAINTAGYMCWVANEGVGAATLTPASGTIDGNANLVLTQFQGVILFWDGTNWETGRGLFSATAPYDVVFSLPGLPDTTFTFPWIVFDRAVTFPANFSGSTGQVLINPTGTTLFTVKKNGSTVGTVSVATSGVCTFATSGGSPVSVVSGDYFTLLTPTQDATLSGLMITLAGIR